MTAAAPVIDAANFLERPSNAAHGDYACTLPMLLARAVKKNPREIAQRMKAALPALPTIARTEIAGAGFINVYLTESARAAVIPQIFAQKERYGCRDLGRGQSALIEFVSANPTGPLHVGHGRQAALGDAIANILSAQNYNVHREFYYNDAGNQIHNLTLSVQARAKTLSGIPFDFPENGYHGEYIVEIAQRYLSEKAGDLDDLEAIRSFAVKALRDEQNVDLTAFGVAFDNFYLESSLYTDKRVDTTVNQLIASGKTYEQDGALWLKTTDFGDDKDRVMRKADGSYTYFVPDVAYHVTKWERGYSRAINIQGSDHHGTIARVRAGLRALNMGIPDAFPEYVLHKMVTVMRGGEEVKISKRAGSYVTVRDLIDEVGRDAVRFFLSMRKADTEFVFDIDLARAKAEENPVYYVQYAHARAMSVLRQAEVDENKMAQSATNAPFHLLTRPHEAALLRRLTDYSDTLAVAAKELSPHYVIAYLRDLASDFHGYYNAERFIVDDADLRHARLCLVAATGRVLKNALALLGISAPQAM
ncbi:MAG: arginine--tRNA ligase [Burkholderiales bacterium]|nr:arginine--tRNA ligase [Burkholderiales bacterium]